MKKQIGNTYTYIENGNSIDSKNLGYSTAQNLKIPVKYVLYIPDIGPSGKSLNNKKYRIIVDGNYVNKTGFELMSTFFNNAVIGCGIIGDAIIGNEIIETLQEISENVEGIPNRLYKGQKLLFSYKGKPDVTSNIDYGPMYDLNLEENKKNMESDVIIQITDVFSDGENTYIDVISPIHLYWIDNNAVMNSEIITNFNQRTVNVINKNYPSNLYVTNIDKINNSVNIDFYFKNSVLSAKSFTIAYRLKQDNGNTDWYYINDIKKSPYKLTNFEINKIYEIKIMTFFDNDHSIFSPTITFKTI